MISVSFDLSSNNHAMLEGSSIYFSEVKYMKIYRTILKDTKELFLCGENM